jgi:hypothetical protein
VHESAPFSTLQTRGVSDLSFFTGYLHLNHWLRH